MPFILFAQNPAPASGADDVGAVVLAVFSIIGGALLTAVAALIGAAIQNRREHAKWVREKRYDAFIQIRHQHARMRLLDETLQELEDEEEPPAGSLAAERRVQQTKDTRANLTKLREDLAEATAALSVLGPDAVATAANEAFEAEWIADERSDAAAAELISAMRKALGLPRK